MRKIEIGKYTCPKCNADLLLIAEDLMFGIRVTSRYKCAGCHEEYYSVEIVGQTKDSPELNCRFCNQKAEYFSVHDSWVDYWKCLACKTTYEKAFSNEVSAIYMYAEIKNNLYVLRQFLKTRKSRIELLPENLEDTVVIAQEFEFLMPSVTPANIQEKLMTYLVFS